MTTKHKSYSRRGVRGAAPLVFFLFLLAVVVVLLWRRRRLRMLLGGHYNLLLLVGHDHRVAIQHCKESGLDNIYQQCSTRQLCLQC